MAGIDNNTLLYLRGDSFTDLSLVPKNITNSGVTVVEGDLFGNSLYFNGSNGCYIILPSLKELEITNEFTFEWYSNFKNHSTNNLRNVQLAIGNYDTSKEFIMTYGFNKPNDAAMYINLSSNGIDWTVRDKAVGTNLFEKTTHHCITYKNNIVTVFLNGVNVYSVNINLKTELCSRIMLGSFSLSNYCPLLGMISNFRISNVARYTEDFTPPTQPYNSITINKTNQTDTNIEFNIEKLGQEIVNKVEVLVNGTVSETYTDNYDNINYLIDTDLCAIGNNKITIRVTYDDTYTEELSLTHKVTVDELPLETPLLDTVERVKLLTKLKQNEKNMLSSILTSKNVEVSEEDKMSDLIGKVDMLGEYYDDKWWLYKDGYINPKNSIKQIFKTNSSIAEGLIYNTDNMKLQCASSGGTAQLYFGTENVVDFTYYSSLNFEYTIVSRYYVNNTNYSSLEFGIHNNNVDQRPFGLAKAEYWLDKTYKLDTKYTVTLNTSNLRSGYITFGLQSLLNDLSIYIHKIWLEK